jgi:oxygen-independent coproporphyrinogen-3 oxidase
VAKLGLVDDFISALVLEIEEAQQWFPFRKFNTLYFGGGTPTLLSYNQLEKIKIALDTCFSFTEDMEFTIECNPEQLNKTYLQELQKLGINRLSIGIQSFNNQILGLLGRLHTAEQAHEAVIRAAEVGFTNISIDLIYGIAEREATMWQQELQLAFSLPITHLSAYSLTVEENTILSQRLKKQSMPLLDENIALHDYELLQQEVAKAGFRQYEVSNYCKEGYHSRHNSAYWNSTPYLGLGAAAHSFTGAMRRWNLPHLENYISCLKTHNRYWEAEQLSLNNRYNEYLLLGLRTEKGIDLQHITTYFGEKYRNLFLQQLSHISPDFYQQQGNHIQLSAKGLLLADDITATLFSLSLL